MGSGLEYQQSKQEFGNLIFRVSLSLCVEDLFPIASFPPASPKSQISLFLHLVTRGCLLKAAILTPAGKLKVKTAEICPEESKEIPTLEFSLKIIKQGRLLRLPTTHLCV